MEEGGGEGGDASEEAPTRWTCEACGCNTNLSSTDRCGICGTNNSGPALLRRGGAAAYAARAGWFARGADSRARRAAAIAGIMGADDAMEDDADLWESVVNDDMAMESLVVGPGGADRSRLVETSRQRFLEAARAFSQANREASGSSAPVANPQELLRAATANASRYQPIWVSNPSTTLMGPRSRSGTNGIEVGGGPERQALAHLPVNAGEGRAIRAEEPFPRDNDSSSNPFSSFRLASEMPGSGLASSSSSNNNNNNEPGSEEAEGPPRRRAYGFRVAFDHPASGDVAGASMGGCYLVGVTTSSFSAYGEQNGLQQSPFFWGIEDSGQKYEGSRHNSGRRRGGGAVYAVEIGASEAPMNAHGVLFGSREVVTCVFDSESRTLTFWRDETLLGTLVSDLPRGVNLFPVAVPFNCGVTVAITGLGNDPLPLLRTFATDWRKAQEEKDQQTRQRLSEERAVLIRNGSMSPELCKVLEEIFCLYADDNCDSVTSLNSTMAGRLWYRCGMKLTSLESILEAKQDTKHATVTLGDFLGVMEKVVEEDEAKVANEPVSDSAAVLSCEIGDKVELVEGYERYGDATSGPLQVGDRGVVVELQRGPNGEKRSVRVLFGGRRWWYQSQAILPERSRLIDSPGVWFLRALLRSHGYDHATLKSMVGKPVTATSWKVGDLVAPRKIPEAQGGDTDTSSMGSMVGYIVPETPGSSSSSSSSLGTTSRGAGTVVVEFTSRAFADAVGLKSTGLSSDAKFTIETRRVRTSKLVHAAADYRFDIVEMTPEEQDGEAMETEGSKPQATADDSEIDDLASSVSEKIHSEVAALSSLDRSAMDTLLKECKKSPEALASLFSVGLPDSILSAIDTAERLMNSLEPRDDLSEKLAGIGALVNAIADQLFGDPEPSQNQDDSATLQVSDEQEPESSSSNPTGNSQAGAVRRSIVRDVLSRRDARRGDHDESQNLASSLQQRRNMLLSLMSRASRRSNAGAFLNEMAEALGEPRELSLDQLPPSMAALRGAPPFVFGSPGDRFGLGEMGWDDPQLMELAAAAGGGNASSARGATNSESPGVNNEAENHESAEQNTESSYLDSLLRCRRGVSAAHLSGGTKQGGAAHSVFVRSLISKGILVDNLEWASSLVDAHSRKVQLSSLAKTSNLLRGVEDEEGTPLLQLAIALGCSADIIVQLIALGAAVGVPEIKKAAQTDQAKTLAALLKHTSYKEGLIHMEQCSPEVAQVLAETKLRQIRLDKKMRDAAGSFMVKLVRKLFKIALSCRRNDSARIDVCSKVLCEMLVGNVLLGALHRAQQAARPPLADAEPDPDRAVADHGGRFPDDLAADLKAYPKGLLRILPRSILGDCLFSEQGVTSFLLVVEEYLSSKEMTDVAAGFSFLLILLRNFPQLRSCTEMDRFGVSEFVASHSVLASNRIAEILSKQFTNGLDVSAGSDGGKEDQPDVSEAGTVVCPKKHTAVLHITRHSSFRCDVCGAGVDRGRPMHGCRECDWDLCEDCNPSGLLVKCTEVRELATECQRILSDDGLPGDASENDEFDYASILERLALVDANSTKVLNELSLRLLRRDVWAAKDLGDRLSDPGQITFHQFLSVILPAIHSSLVGRPNGGDGAVHRNKKAKVIGASDSSAMDSLDARIDFCRESLKNMVEEKKIAPSDAAQAATGSEEPGNAKEDDEGTGRVDITYCAGASEILRRLHQILSFYEGVKVFSSSPEKASRSSSSPQGKAADLPTLTKPIELHLQPSKLHELETVSPKSHAVIHAEPLVPFMDLQLHILRTFKANDPVYVAFCRRLASENAIIIERPMNSKMGTWRVAQIKGFDTVTGSHSVRYASSWKRGKEQSTLHLSLEDARDFSSFFRFNTGLESDLVLAARQYFIVFRAESSAVQKECALATSDGPDETMEEGAAEDWGPSNRLLQAVGTRVESTCGRDGGWSVYTLVGTDGATGNSEDEMRFVLVSDEGELFSGVHANQIRAQSATTQQDDRSRSRRAARAPRDDRGGLFPFFAVRSREDYTRGDSESSANSLCPAKIFKRSWSALSLADAMQPVNLQLSEGTNKVVELKASSGFLTFACSLEGSEFVVSADASRVEPPPRLCVKFSCHEKLTGIDLPLSADKTLVWALKEIQRRQEKCAEWPPKATCRLYFSVKAEAPDASSAPLPPTSLTAVPLSEIETRKMDTSWPRRVESRSRKLSSSSTLVDDDDETSPLCDGVDEICIQCMECVNMISECAEDRSTLDEKDGPRLPGFSNATLSKKLIEQLEDPVCVVGGALPDWCIAAPSFAPRIFSYQSRKALLERAAFGPSRSTLKQQEAKINVGRLRQRMASLRARAVELVGEAFSGGASDPTALQLQADELYGMEEALATRVRAAFSAVKWQEYSLQVAKAAVRRENLLADASSIMERYANDDSVCRRRLEVRFEGESGFDAASGDEAGVTRGFYADVAETLLSTDLVAGVYCSSTCAPASAASLKDDVVQPMEVDDIEPEEEPKLPLWIPDMDSSSQVIIPTPRADPQSSLGVFPRSIPHYHPQYDDVLERFRLIGRLFAAAMRDGFMFPLPLSSSFLKLVQKGTEPPASTLEASRTTYVASDFILTTGDLPRPGFIGGEVYAAEMFVCRALDRLDSASPPLSRHELKRRYEEIATDKSFASEALGKSYECSFEEYFQDRTFVDPLDPGQGEDAVPLCPKGYAKPVTIYNVREWVALAKNFILHEGVVAQALAFRRGVEDFFPPEFLSVFTAEELHRDVCGGDDRVDKWDESAIRKIFKLDGGKGAAEALVAVAAIGGEGGAALSRRFGPSSPTIGFLVKALLEASPKQRRQFLSFVTSVPIVTPGRIEVVPILSPSGTFLPMRDPGCLPRANTCARRLYLPKFETYETFSEVLWAVVGEESRFKGFYEWRGS